MGQYHGKYSFDTFSHKKSILYKDLGAIGEKLATARYPPYSPGKIKYLNFMLSSKPGLPLKFVPYLLMFLLGYAASFAVKYYWKL